MDMLLADARIFIPRMGGREALFKHEVGSSGRYLQLPPIAFVFASSRVVREDAGDWTVSLSICRCSNMGLQRHIITYYLHLWLKHTFKLQLHPLLSLPLAFHFIPLQRLLCNSVLQLRNLCFLYNSLSFSLCRFPSLSLFHQMVKEVRSSHSLRGVWWVNLLPSAIALSAHFLHLTCTHMKKFSQIENKFFFLL